MDVCIGLFNLVERAFLELVRVETILSFIERQVEHDSKCAGRDIISEQCILILSELSLLDWDGKFTTDSFDWLLQIL